MALQGAASAKLNSASFQPVFDSRRADVLALES